MRPDLAMELSAWYRGPVSTARGPYGYANDRKVNPDSHLVWLRGLIAYTLPERKDNIALTLTLGRASVWIALALTASAGCCPSLPNFPSASLDIIIRKLMPASLSSWVGPIHSNSAPCGHGLFRPPPPVSITRPAWSSPVIGTPALEPESGFALREALPTSFLAMAME